MSLLRECQQGIELLQIRRFHDDRRRGRKFHTRLRQRDDGARVQGGQEHTQGVVDGDLAVVGGVMQDLQVFPGAVSFLADRAEPVVGDAEAP